MLPPSSNGKADHTDRSLERSGVTPGIHVSGVPSRPATVSTVMAAHGALSFGMIRVVRAGW
jgi:hypothetical protein